LEAQKRLLVYVPELSYFILPSLAETLSPPKSASMAWKYKNASLVRGVGEFGELYFLTKPGQILRVDFLTFIGLLAQNQPLASRKWQNPNFWEYQPILQIA